MGFDLLIPNMKKKIESIKKITDWYEETISLPIYYTAAGFPPNVIPVDPTTKDYLVINNLSIERRDSSGNLIWQVSGADINTSVDSIMPVLTVYNNKVYAFAWDSGVTPNILYFAEIDLWTGNVLNVVAIHVNTINPALIVPRRVFIRPNGNNIEFRHRSDIYSINFSAGTFSVSTTEDSYKGYINPNGIQFDGITFALNYSSTYIYETSQPVFQIRDLNTGDVIRLPANSILGGTKPATEAQHANYDLGIVVLGNDGICKMSDLDAFLDKVASKPRLVL